MSGFVCLGPDHVRMSVMAAQPEIRSVRGERKPSSEGEGEPMTVFTVAFCGTACTRDEGEASRSGSDMRIYSPDTGYVPVRIHKEISGDLRAARPSVTVRGVGENDWAVPRDTSEPLVL